MKYFNLLLFAVLLGLLVMEGKRTLTNYKSCKDARKNVMDTKTNIVIVKDYMLSVTIYAIMIVLIFASGVYNLIIKDYFTAIMILGLALFWVNFIIENICTKLVIFYESGFLYLDKQYKYRNVTGISDDKKFARGYEVKVIGAEEVYITKKMRPILEEKLKEYKNRKKK